MIASGPLVACAGATPGAPEGAGGDGNALGASAGAGTAPTSGSSSTAGAASGGQGTTDNPFQSNGGLNAGGNPFANVGTAGSSGGPGLGGAATGQAGSAPLPDGPIAAGNVSGVALGSLAIVARSFLLGRDAKGLYAMSLQCTHQGCAVVQQSGNQLFCPCHKSVFDSNGAVLVGPAKLPLPHFAVTVDAAGNITVDMYAVVGVNVRTAV